MSPAAPPSAHDAYSTTVRSTRDADDHAAKLTADKKSTHFVQPVKEPMEQKETKEKEKA